MILRIFPTLPKRPTAPVAYGGRGYTAQEMKAAFDKLPLLLVDRFNSLLTDIEATGEEGISGSIKTGLATGHTLADLFCDITNGNLSSYLTVGDKALIERILSLEEELAEIKAMLKS